MIKPESLASIETERQRRWIHLDEQSAPPTCGRGNAIRGSHQQLCSTGAQNYSSIHDMERES